MLFFIANTCLLTRNNWKNTPLEISELQKNLNAFPNGAILMKQICVIM